MNKIKDLIYNTAFRIINNVRCTIFFRKFLCELTMANADNSSCPT